MPNKVQIQPWIHPNVKLAVQLHAAKTHRTISKVVQKYLILGLEAEKHESPELLKNLNLN